MIIPNVDIIFSYGIVWQQNMEEISYSGSKGSSKKRLPKRLIVFGGLFLVVLLLLGSAGYFITRSGSSNSENDDSSSITLPEDSSSEISETPTPTEEISVTPEKSTAPSKAPSKTPTKAPGTSSANKSDIKISVQNGSGETGAAKAAADVLTGADFTVVSTGNADNTDYTDVTIQIKNSQKSHLSAIEDALSKDYTVGDTSADLPESTSYDVLVIIGK